MLEPALVERGAHLLAGADGNGALQHEHGVALDARELVDDRPDAGEVGVARVRDGRRVDADEQELGAVDRLARVEREGEPLGVLREQLVEARLEDRHLAPLEPVDLLGDDVADDHVVAELREARSSDEADVACAEDADPAHGREAYPGGNGRRPLAIESMVSLESLSSSEFTTQ